MSLQHLANHVAQKGRHGDSTLVHVSKGELAGLQALAKNSGTTLTVNPQTGLPEAFNLRSLLPMAAGAALMATGVGAPLAAGLVGGGTFLATGSLQKGLMAGLGAYGGAGLAGGLSAAGTQAVAGETMAAEAAQAQALAETQTQAAQLQAAQAQAAEQATQQAALNTAGQTATTPQAIENIASQQNALYNQPQPVVQTSSLMGEGPVLTKPIAPALGDASAGMKPLDPSIRGATATADQLAAAKANTSASELMKRGVSSLGTEAGRNAAIQGMGGGMDALKYGASALSSSMEKEPYKEPELKGDSDMGQRYMYESGYDPSIPGRTANPSYTKVSNEEARKYYGFAEGGSTSGAAASAPSGYGAYTAQDANTAAYGLGTGIDYSGYDTAPNQGIGALTPSVNPNQNIVDLYKEVDAKKTADEAAAKAKKEADAIDAASNYWAGAGAGGGLMPRDLSYAGGGGISTLGGYSDGGRLLKGPGDGMSDNIPAQIGAKQPARLADGEFVVPADVVSHLGNGSTDAGAKQLYKMMDKIRAARTGRKTQGKQINPNKFVPA